MLCNYKITEIFQMEVFYMPIYEYSCTECNEVFSVLQNINSNKSNISCPGCGSGNIKKKVSAFSCCSIGSGSNSFADKSAGGFGGFGGG
jgi:putative FmdB family regulatory protein